jgi:hypothetical protein
MRVQILLFISLLLGGCIGTDYIEEIAEPVEPRIVITPSISALELGDTMVFEAILYDETGIRVESSFTWNTSAPDVASVDNQGTVTTLAPGQTMITASALNVTSAPALLTVVVNAGAIARVVVLPDTLRLEIGETDQLRASFFDLNNNAVTPVEVSWTSSNPAVATVDASGIIEAVAPGVAYITATADGVKSLPVVVFVGGNTRTGFFTPNPGTTYTVEGIAIMERLSGGNIRVQFDDSFRVSSGPNLKVFLSTRRAVTDTSLDIGVLKKNGGSQTYNVPAGIELADFDYVIIHCVPFNVTFGYAEFGSEE